MSRDYGRLDDALDPELLDNNSRCLSPDNVCGPRDGQVGDLEPAHTVVSRLGWD
ncbi:hypothetical protein EDB86DRAFT_3081385 [Lactarius hatsudake]|nr:hypothetical protein EDB86DRAFT_3081385 [Lactarius hatsudake]